MEGVLPIIVVSGLGVLLLMFLNLRLQAYLMFFQQEEYDAPRFRDWMRRERAGDRMASLIVLIGALMAFGPAYGFFMGVPLGIFVTALGLIEGSRRSRKVLRAPKKGLVLTERAKRILTTALTVAIGLTVIAWIVIKSIGLPAGVFIAILFAVTQTHHFLLLANKMLQPSEEKVKAKFRAEAEAKLAELNPKVIAITGSFGKTSAKHILLHVLSSVYPTLATPGSVNTVMGITRVIREQLEARHKYFIVEMGAYGPGSIDRLCRFTPPDAGVVTAVGDAHYERFKSLEAVFHTKFEIVDHSFDRGGPAIVNAAGIPDEFLRPRLEEVPGDYTLVGDMDTPMACDFTLTAVKQTREGLALTIAERAEDGSMTSHDIKVPLYGTQQADNVATVVAIARRIGLEMETIKAALATCPQIAHRLDVTRGKGQPTLINDAYNSNPIGFEAALNLLPILKYEGGRGIVVTPGMVELGARHDGEHQRLGKLTAELADIAIVVTPDRIPTYVEGIKSVSSDIKLITFDKQADAESWVKANVKAEDAVLYENNLPDLYEARVRF